MQQPPPPPPPPPASPAPAFPTPYGQPHPYGYAQQPPYGYPGAPRRRRRWWLWGCGGCGALALVLVAVFAVVGINVFSNSPLRHFPTEPGASTVSDNFNVSNGQSSEAMVIDDPHALSNVEAFYQSALHAGGWTVDTADPSQATSGDAWHIGRTGSSGQAGLITFVSIAGGTQITIQYVY